jgi:hypothetical protein
MRESSSEKDLKRLLSNVTVQLDAIKRCYLVFKDSQLDLVSQYPQMVKDELQKYQESVFKFFSIQPDGSKIISEENEPPADPDNEDAEIKKIETNNKNFHLGDGKEQPDSMRFILKEILNTDRGTKFYVTMRSPLDQNASHHLSRLHKNDSKESEHDNDDLLAFDDLIPNTKKDLINEIDSKLYLKHTYIPVDMIIGVKNV